MLDWTQPMAQHISQAAALMDGVMLRGQRMSVSPSTMRTELLVECAPLFTEIRELAHTHFGNQAAFIAAKTDEFEAVIRKLAGMVEGPITEDRGNGTGACPVCGTTITHYPEYWVVLCGECTKPLMAAYRNLDSSEGFGTWVI